MGGGIGVKGQELEVKKIHEWSL